jgi:NAD(P)-dependent dehydrogenase (short-subunit alcohol dehydrogenase family)
MGRLDGKVALVTGAGRGIGAAIARRFHAEGASVAVNDLDRDAARGVATELDGLAVPADVTDSAAVTAMVEAVAQRFGRLDILIANAGVSGYEGRGERMQRIAETMYRQAGEMMTGEPLSTHLDETPLVTDAEWSTVMRVNLDGTFYCCRAVLPVMARQGSGCIITMGSILGTSGAGAVLAYSAAKAGIMGLTRALAREQASRGIRVNCIAPGWIATEMTQPMQEMWPLLIAQTPLGRIGDVDDVAGAALYLAGEDAKFVTGQVLSPNGGWYMSQ